MRRPRVKAVLIVSSDIQDIVMAELVPENIFFFSGKMCFQSSSFWPVNTSHTSYYPDLAMWKIFFYSPKWRRQQTRTRTGKGTRENGGAPEQPHGNIQKCRDQWKERLFCERDSTLKPTTSFFIYVISICVQRKGKEVISYELLVILPRVPNTARRRHKIQDWGRTRKNFVFCLIEKLDTTAKIRKPSAGSCGSRSPLFFLLLLLRRIFPHRRNERSQFALPFALLTPR